MSNSSFIIPLVFLPNIVSPSIEHCVIYSPTIHNAEWNIINNSTHSNINLKLLRRV